MLKPTETPLHSWNKLGLDIFQLKGIHYLLMVDYFSQFPVLWRLSTLHSQSIINNLKQIFTEIGVPRSIVTDGGTQFTAQEFKDFTQAWNIEHRVTSPTNAQSNGIRLNDLCKPSRTVSQKLWREERIPT